VEKAHGYFERYGAKTIVIARFIPIVRTFANPVAGISRMSGRSFAVFNLIGGLLWVVSVTMLGYVLGKTIPSADKHLFLIEGIIVALSLIPVGVEVVRSRRRAKSADPGERVDA
jgi:membrane-associated protein